MSGVATAIIGGSVLGIAGTALSANSSPDVSNDFLQNPQFPNSQAARDTWWQTLQNQQNDPTGAYGAIAPDWNDIWQQTQQQVKNYYEGSATTPGVNDAIKGSFAQRGMGGQAGETFALSASGANEAQQLGGLSAQQNIAKNQFALQGQQNWMNSLANFQAQKPTGEWQTQVNPSSGQIWGNALSQLGGAVGSYGTQALSQKQSSNWMSSMGGVASGSGIATPSQLGYTSYTGM